MALSVGLRNEIKLRPVDTFSMQRFQQQRPAVIAASAAQKDLGCGRWIVSDKTTPIHELSGHAVVVLCVEPN
jgi:hypothetical protein